MVLLRAQAKETERSERKRSRGDDGGDSSGDDERREKKKKHKKEKKSRWGGREAVSSASFVKCLFQLLAARGACAAVQGAHQEGGGVHALWVAPSVAAAQGAFAAARTA